MKRLHGFTLIEIDGENAAHVFWDNDIYMADCPKEIYQELAVNGSDRIIVTDARAEQIEAWCRAQPGFSDGPAFARNALIFARITQLPEHSPAAWKFTDPTEACRWIYDEDEAREIASEDPSLIVPVIWL